MDMNNKLLHDKNTNAVFLSPCLNTKKYGNPKFYNELMTILKEMGIETRELKCTRDYWASDYMDHMEIGMTPPEGSENWIARFAQDAFDKIIRPHRVIANFIISTCTLEIS